MHWFVLVLGQIEYQEILRLIDNEELTQAGHKLALNVGLCYFSVVVTEEQRAPLNLHNWELANVVPQGDWSSVVVMEYPKTKMKEMKLTQLNRS